MKLLFRFLKIAIAAYDQYKIEYVYSLILATSSIIIMPLLWFFLTDGGKTGIGTWNLGGLTLISVLFGVILSLCDIMGVWDSWWLVSNEEGRKRLVTYFTKPVHPLVMLYGNGINLAGIVRFFFCIIAALIFISYFGLSLNLAFVFLILFGAVILLNLMTYPFFVMIAYEKGGSPVGDVVWSIVRYADLPLTHLGGIAAVVTTILFPVAFIAAIPAESLVLEPNTSVIFVSATMAIITTAISYLLWQFAKRRYEAVGG